MVVDPDENIFEQRSGGSLLEIAEWGDGNLMVSISSRTDFAEVEIDGESLYRALHERYGK